MKETGIFIAAVLVGMSFLLFSLSNYEVESSRVKIESIERLYKLKAHLEKENQINKVDSLIRETDKKIDSINKTRN